MGISVTVKTEMKGGLKIMNKDSWYVLMAMSYTLKQKRSVRKSR